MLQRSAEMSQHYRDVWHSGSTYSSGRIQLQVRSTEVQSSSDIELPVGAHRRDRPSTAAPRDPTPHPNPVAAPRCMHALWRSP